MSNPTHERRRARARSELVGIPVVPTIPVLGVLPYLLGREGVAQSLIRLGERFGRGGIFAMPLPGGSQKVFVCSAALAEEVLDDDRTVAFFDAPEEERAMLTRERAHSSPKGLFTSETAMSNPTQERRHARARSEIIESAARAFAKKGFHGTSVDDVAREAGMSPSSLYRYFESKEALYRAMLDNIADVVLAPFGDPLLPTLSFDRRLEWLLRRQLTTIESQREFFITFASERASMDWELAGTGDPVGDAYLRWVTAFRTLLEEGVANGFLRPLDTWNTAYLVTGALSATVFRWIRGQLPVALQDYVPVLLDMIFCGIRAERQP